MSGTTLKSSARRTYLLLGVKCVILELPDSIIKPYLPKKVVLFDFSIFFILLILLSKWVEKLIFLNFSQKSNSTTFFVSKNYHMNVCAKFNDS
jgi:hypothetical protein